MMSLPQNAVVRRINELVKRARSVKVHAYIVHYLKKQMPYVIGECSAVSEFQARSPAVQLGPDCFVSWQM
jgi:hypothetical protein